MRKCSSAEFTKLVALCSLIFLGADWPQFRGPGGKGVSDATGLPSSWDESTNIRWKVDLPGPGASSPVVVGDRIFVTSYGGYGVQKDEPGDEADLRRHITCYNLADGSLIWNVPSRARLPEYPYQGFQAFHGYASSTPASDGESLFIFFGKTGVARLNLADGWPKWAENVGMTTHEWGSGTSPVLHGDMVIINASVESKSLVALNKNTGRQVWKVDGMEESWSTPALVTAPDGSTELVVSVKHLILGLDPQTGDRLWECQGIKDYICPSVLAHDGVAYVLGGRKVTATAVRAGGRGDVTDSHTVWNIDEGSNVSSPVYHEGHLYWAHEKGGIVYCVNAKTGDVIYKERLDPRPRLIYASPLLADGKIYHVSREKGIFVLAAKPEFELLSYMAPMDDSIHNASLIVGGGNLLLRTDKCLYCIGK